MALVDDYEDAVRRDLPTKNYLAQMVAASAGLPIQGVTAALPSQLPNRDKSASENGFWGGLQSGVSGLLDALDSIDPSAPGKGSKGPLSGAADLLGGISDAVSGTSAAVKFITDIPRVATTLLGLILIIAGIFALAKGPAVQVMGALKP